MIIPNQELRANAIVVATVRARTRIQIPIVSGLEAKKREQIIDIESISEK